MVPNNPPVGEIAGGVIVEYLRVAVGLRNVRPTATLNYDLRLFTSSVSLGRIVIASPMTP